LIGNVCFAFHQNVYLTLQLKHNELIDTSLASKSDFDIHAMYLSNSNFDQIEIFWMDFGKSNHKNFTILNGNG
jgi:hypothetical protein